MEDQIGTVLHWSNQKEPKQAERKDGVIRRNLDRIRNAATTPLPSNPSRNGQMSLIQNIKNNNNTRFQLHLQLNVFPALFKWTCDLDL